MALFVLDDLNFMRPIDQEEIGLRLTLIYSQVLSDRTIQ